MCCFLPAFRFWRCSTLLLLAGRECQSGKTACSVERYMTCASSLCYLQGENAKTVARALRAAGVRRSYTLAGGFKAWQAAGLGVKQVRAADWGCRRGCTWAHVHGAGLFVPGCLLARIAAHCAQTDQVLAPPTLKLVLADL